MYDFTTDDTAERTATLTIDERVVELTVRAPTPLEMDMLLLQMPERALDLTGGDDIRRHLAFEEVADYMHLLITETTDLPRSLVEDLPVFTVEDLADAALRVIEDEYGEDPREEVDPAENLDEFFRDTQNSDFVDRVMDAEAEMNAAGSSGLNTDEGAGPSFDSLTDVSGVGPAKADDLRDAQFYTIEDLRKASQQEIAEVVGNALAARIRADIGGHDE